jgi:hypothetical protein
MLVTLPRHLNSTFVISASESIFIQQGAELTNSLHKSRNEHLRQSLPFIPSISCSTPSIIIPFFTSMTFSYSFLSFKNSQF